MTDPDVDLRIAELYDELAALHRQRAIAAKQARGKRTVPQRERPKLDVVPNDLQRAKARRCLGRGGHR